MPAEACDGVPTLHALVLQRDRGEIGAVEIATNDSARVLDSDPLVPGKTFVDAGDLPVELVVPPSQPGDPSRGPAWVYAASVGQRTVRAIPSCQFRAGKGCSEEFSGLDRVDLPGRPSAMTLGPDGTSLLVSVPDLSAVVRVALGEANPDAPAALPAPFGQTDDGPDVEMVQLAPWDPDSLRVLPAAEQDDRYQAICGEQVQSVQGPLLSTAPFSPAMATAPSPGEIRVVQVDGGTPIVLVADVALPVLHVLEQGEAGLVPGEPLRTDAPLRTFAVSPEVPVSIGALSYASTDSSKDGPGQPDPDATDAGVVDAGAMDAGGTDAEGPGDGGSEAGSSTEDASERFSEQTLRYLYGVDDRDGSLLVFQLAPDPRSEEPLRPLSFGATRSLRRFSDRVDVPGSIRSLAVIDTRGEDASVCAPSSAKDEESEGEESEGEEEEEEEEEAGASRLRGVSLSVATASGRVYFMDVHDLDIHCRVADSCTSEIALVSEKQPVLLRRHERRMSLPGSPYADVDDDGVFESLGMFADDAPEPDCPAGFAPYLSLDPEASVKVCGVADPWRLRKQVWRGDFEGTLPDSYGTGATLVSGGAGAVLELPAPYDGCQMGVLPPQADLDGEAYQGDWLVLDGSQVRSDESGCAFHTESFEYLLPVVSSRVDALEVGDGLQVRLAAGSDPVVGLAEPLPVEGDVTLDSLLACLNAPIRFSVRARDRHLLVGSTDGYLHRMRADPGGECQIDDSLDPYYRARLRLPSVSGESTRFQNTQVYFVAGPSSEKSASEVELNLTVGRNGRADLGLVLSGALDGTSTLPSQVRYHEETGTLYVLDGIAQGLRRYSLRPLALELPVVN